jgi:hypothetical protein
MITSMKYNMKTDHMKRQLYSNDVHDLICYKTLNYILVSYNMKEIHKKNIDSFDDCFVCYSKFFNFSHTQKDTSGQNWLFQETVLHQALSIANPTLSLGFPLLPSTRQWLFQEIGLAGASHRQYSGSALRELVSKISVHEN